MAREINVGLIGFGLAGRVFHGPLLSSVQGFKIKAIYTTNQENASKAKNLHPDAKIVGDVKKIYADKTIDLIVVVSPNTSHYDLASMAIKAGKHVIVDKPFMITSQDADKIIEMAEQKGVMLSVYQNRRWDSDYLTIKKLIHQGMVGDVVEFESRMDRYAPVVKQGWRSEDIPGSGMLYDLGSHLIDQALDLFGNPQAVTADVSKQRKGSKSDDWFQVTLHYPSGLRVILKSTMLARVPTPRFMLTGQNGVFIKYGTDVQEDMLKNGLLPKEIEDWGKEPGAIHGHLCTTLHGIDFDGRVVSENGDYSKYYENIQAVLNENEQLIVTPQQARNVIRTIEYAAQSAATGQTILCDDWKGLMK